MGLLSFLLGWGVTITAGLMSYPIDTIRRRMMMTSGSAVKYKGSVDCGIQVIKNEGFMSLMKGAGANILRGVWCRCLGRIRQIQGSIFGMEIGLSSRSVLNSQIYPFKKSVFDQVKVATLVSARKMVHH